MTVAAEIRAEMGRKKMGQSTLSAISGVSETTLWRKLITESSYFKYDELQSISKALNIPLSELIARAEQNQEEKDTEK